MEGVLNNDVLIHRQKILKLFYNPLKPVSTVSVTRRLNRDYNTMGLTN
jgi:hypothetical protein